MNPNGNVDPRPPGSSSGRTASASAVAAIPLAIGLLSGVLVDGSESVPAAGADDIVPLAVNVGGETFRVFFGNLHSHTGLSDGSSEPRRAYAHARDVARLDFLAITEHNHASAGSIQNDPDLYRDELVAVAPQFTETGRFVALYGQEFSSISSGNHANVLGVTDVISSAAVPNGDWRALLETWLPGHLDSSGQQALLLLNHPATSGSPNSREYGIDDFGPNGIKEWRNALNARAQLINIINGPSHDADNPPGAPSESEYRRYLNLGFHLGPTADQDNHLENWGSAAATRTGVLAPELSQTAIMAALRERRVYASEDHNLRLVMQVNGHVMGSRLNGSLPVPGDELSISLVIQDDDEPSATYQVDVFSDVPGGENADIVRSAMVSGNGVFAIPGVPFEGDGQYIFLRIAQEHDEDLEDDRAWTAPVWFEGAAPAPPGGNAAVDLAVDLVREEARITNLGTTPIDLTDWRLLSVRGNQEFTFPALQLLPGTTVTVISGPDAIEDPPLRLLWTNQHVWSNSGDPGELYDADGHLVMRVGG